MPDLPTTPLNRRDADVLIIGGGLAGLSCALGLLHAGLRIQLVEASPNWGGRARSCTDERTGDRIDIGPHVILTEYPNFRWLLRTLGTEGEIVWERDKVLTLVSERHVTTIRSRPLPAPLHLFPSMLKARDVSLRDKLSSARALWLGLRFQEQDVARFDAIPVSTLLRSLRVSPGFIDWFWRSATMCLLNVPLEKCSAGAALRLMAQFLGRADGRFGFAARPLEELFFPSSRRLIETAGGQLHENCAVTELMHSDGVCTGARLRSGEVISARFCVAAIPPADLLRILPEQWKGVPPFAGLQRFAPSPYVSLYLWFDRKLTRERVWTRTWTPEEFNFDFYDLSNIRAEWRERPSIIASNIIHSHCAERFTDEELVQQTLRELAAFVPDIGQCRLLNYRVHRIPMAIPCPAPGTEVARPASASGFAGLVLAGDWTRTALPASMESAVRSGLLAAEQILSEVGAPRALARMPRPPGGIARIIQSLERDRAPLDVPT
jgi:squalene-associated FAD-dependent desaturase